MTPAAMTKATTPGREAISGDRATLTVSVDADLVPESPVCVRAAERRHRAESLEIRGESVASARRGATLHGMGVSNGVVLAGADGDFNVVPSAQVVVSVMMMTSDFGCKKRMSQYGGPPPSKVQTERRYRPKARTLSS